MYEILVVNVRKKHINKRNVINIMRPTPLSNPFKSDENNTREEVIEEYSKWLKQVLLDETSKQYKEFTRLLQILKTDGILTLECCCKPLACHGDILREELLSHIKSKGIDESILHIHRFSRTADLSSFF